MLWLVSTVSPWAACTEGPATAPVALSVPETGEDTAVAARPFEVIEQW
jgi:hypothetical protein